MGGSVRIYSAVGTPLADSDLHAEGLRSHLADQWEAGIDGVLVAGTMGAMQLLTDKTYQQLVRQSAEYCRGKGTILIGVGDASFARTLERIEFVNKFPVDGVVVLPPYFLKFSEEELYSYFAELAKHSRVPLYLYDLHQRTGVSLRVETILRLAECPGIAGIKCSGDVPKGRRLARALEGSDFSVFFADATALDMLILAGATNHLDGIYCVVPRLTMAIAKAASEGDLVASQKGMALLDKLLAAVVAHGVFPSIGALLNHRGIPGNFAPAPFAPLSPKVMDDFLSDPVVQEALQVG